MSAVEGLRGGTFRAWQAPDWAELAQPIVGDREFAKLWKRFKTEAKPKKKDGKRLYIPNNGGEPFDGRITAYALELLKHALATGQNKWLRRAKKMLRVVLADAKDDDGLLVDRKDGVWILCQSGRADRWQGNVLNKTAATFFELQQIAQVLAQLGKTKMGDKCAKIARMGCELLASDDNKYGMPAFIPPGLEHPLDYRAGERGDAGHHWVSLIQVSWAFIATGVDPGGLRPSARWVARWLDAHPDDPDGGKGRRGRDAAAWWRAVAA